jgi:hypothetical protein
MPDTEQAITTGELSRAVGLIRGDIGQLRIDVNARPDWQDIRRVEEGLLARIQALAAQAELKDQLQDKALAALEDWQKWALRLGAPAVVAAVVGMAANAIRLAGT